MIANSKKSKALIICKQCKERVLAEVTTYNTSGGKERQVIKFIKHKHKYE